MAKRSKTQRAKASAARQAKKEAREFEESQDVELSEDAKESEESKSKTLFKKKDSESAPEKKGDAASKKEIKKSEEKPKKKHFQFFRDVKAELKRVTWPTRSDVMRWTGVVAVALVFFGVFVAVLDNLIITPLLVLVSGADPSTIDWMSVFTGGDNFDASSSAGADAGADASSADVSADAGSDSSDAASTEDGQTEEAGDSEGSDD